MNLLETKTSYVWLEDIEDLKDIEVYVDGSFNFLPEHANRASSFFGAGWSIKAGSHLAGYGVNLFEDTPTPSSALSELRSILSFLDTMHQHFPGVLEDRKVTIVCDNAGIVRGVSESMLNEEWSRRSWELYGKDFARIVYYLKTMNLSCQWVKGHADNEFNQVADILARKAYRMMSAGRTWGLKARREWIDSTISPYRLRLGKFDQENLSSPAELLKFISVHGIHSEIPVIWVNTHLETKDGMNISGISHVNNDGRISGSKAVVSARRFMPHCMEMRALRYALIEYKKDAKTDIENTIIVRLQSDFVIETIHNMMNGTIPKVNRRNDRLKHEVDMLADAVKGLKILPMSPNKMKKNCKNYQRDPQIRQTFDMAREAAELVCEKI